MIKILKVCNITKIRNNLCQQNHQDTCVYVCLTTVLDRAPWPSIHPSIHPSACNTPDHLSQDFVGLLKYEARSDQANTPPERHWLPALRLLPSIWPETFIQAACSFWNMFQESTIKHRFQIWTRRPIYVDLRQCMLIYANLMNAFHSADWTGAPGPSSFCLRLMVSCRQNWSNWTQNCSHPCPPRFLSRVPPIQAAFLVHLQEPGTVEIVGSLLKTWSLGKFDVLYMETLVWAI